MIPTKTLRQRMRDGFNRMSVPPFSQSQELFDELVEAAIQAIGDPCLMKTADSLEPTFTLRAQDLTADKLVADWANMALARTNGIRTPKIDDADACADAMRAWPVRKWPD